jgi:hypothetical protein
VADLSRAVAQEITTSIEVLRGALEDLMVRGVRVASADDVRALASLAEDLRGAGATHLAERVEGTLLAVKASRSDAAQLLMRAMASLRVYERVLSLRVAATEIELAFAAADEDEDDEEGDEDGDEEGDEDEGPAVSAPDRVAVQTQLPPLDLDRKGALPVAEGIVAATEELLAAGLTAVSEATRSKLDFVTKEASRLKLARIAAALKYGSDELGRYLAKSDSFSKRRYAFFTGRAWLLGRSLATALRAGDDAMIARLLLSPAPVMVPRIELVTLGIGKRVAIGTQVAFELRLRPTHPVPGFVTPPRLVWSVVFAYREGIPAEAFLHLPQPQKFQARSFLEKRAVVLENVALAPDDSGGARLILGPKTTLTVAGDAFKAWDGHYDWDVERAIARVRAHGVSPLDLEVELHEEVLLEGYAIGAPTLREDRGQYVYPTQHGRTTLDLIVSSGPDGKELRAAMDALRDASATSSPPPLFGVMHYELGALVVQPLATLGPDGPNYLPISNERIDPATLLKSIKF